MFSFELLVFFAFIIAYAVISIFLLRYAWRLERKYDEIFFSLGFIIFFIFFPFILYSVFLSFSDVPGLISSLVISELTLALVWVELSKRAEIKLININPILHEASGTTVFRFGQNAGKLSDPFGVFAIRKASKLKISHFFSFSFQVANVGYEEITVHEVVTTLGQKRNDPQPLFSSINPDERLSLKTKQRHLVNIEPLFIKKPGFYKIRFEVLAAAVEGSKEIWFFVSDDFSKLQYIEMHAFKKILSPLIKYKLKKNLTSN